MNNFKVFVDFDGTITREDVGAGIFLNYGIRPDVDNIENDIRAHIITAYDGWMKLFDKAPGLTMQQVEEFASRVDIDRSFHDFLNFCQTASIPVCVLSDGFDNYIDLIFKREGIPALTKYSNSLTLFQGKLSPVFPYPDEECTDCANCKRNHILENSRDEDFTVYIGNGSSDTCPAQFCDFIFAKDDLLKYCERNRISYFPYYSFTDVISRLRELTSKKRLKKRHQASLKRIEVYKLG